MVRPRYKNKNNFHAKYEKKTPRERGNGHDYFLNYICNHPDSIGINTSKLLSIIKEPVILKYDCKNKEPECDLIFLSDTPYNYSILVEIKSDKTYSSMRAYEQLENTKRRVCDRIGYPVEKMIIVYYPSMKRQEFNVYQQELQKKLIVRKL